MGAASADFDGDGLLDIFKTDFADDTHTMYKNRGGNNFDDETIGPGLGTNTKYLGWGPAFDDFGQDACEDVWGAHGAAVPQGGARPPPAHAHAPPVHQRSRCD